MINYEDLLASLQDGKTAEDLAAQFTEALNRASQEAEEIQKKEEEKAKLDAELETYQINWVRSLMATMNEYVSRIYPELTEKFNEITESTTDEECLSMCLQIDSMLQMLLLFGKLGF